MRQYPYTQDIPRDMLEIVDKNDRPLLLTSYKIAKHLPHRFVVLIIRDFEGKILLWRSKKKKSSIPQDMGEAMSLLYSHVDAGEARENTAIRLLEKNIPVLARAPRILEELSTMQSITLRLTSEEFVAPFTAQNPMTIFSLSLTKEEKSLLNKDLLWLDKDEIHGIATHFADMLTPSTLQLIRGNALQSLFS